MMSSPIVIAVFYTLICLVCFCDGEFLNTRNDLNFQKELHELTQLVRASLTGTAKEMENFKIRKQLFRFHNGSQKISDANQNRRSTYLQMCFLNTSTKRFGMSPSNYAISDKNHLLYYEIPKAASTAVRTLITSNFDGLTALQRGSFLLTTFQLKYYKFTFIRDPIDRFISNFNFLTVFQNVSTVYFDDIR